MFLLVPIVRRLLMLAIVLAIPLVAAELLARHFIGDAVSSAVGARIGTHAHVGFGSTPLLVQIVRGRLGDVTVSASGATVGGLSPLRIEGSLRDVHLQNLTALEGAIGSLSVTADAPPSVVRGMLASPSCLGGMSAALRAGLTSDPRVLIFPGRIDLLPQRGRGAEIRFVPRAGGSAVRFEIVAALIGGVAVARPPACERQLDGLPFGVRLHSAQARSGTLVLGFTGHGASFSALG
ncbi:MAG TPA: DUF2993 domain-containing protein [Solirubrobacteraceae bacterium]|jgi:hypothetical protein|nr:DUF2993 domain-containing protein [Solirubrobacteraceae bacterium]